MIGRMTAGVDIIDAAIAAARARDLDRLRELVDWPLTGAVTIASGLPGIRERDRAAAAASGLRDLAEAQQRTDLVGEALLPVATVLLGAQDVQPAAPAERAAAEAAIQVPEVPPGLTPDQTAQFDRLRARAAQVTEAYVVRGSEGTATLLRAPDTGRLVLLD